ncbi:hypothetical protein KAJ87_02655 [Candidatus Pacearchaeota archaeon]|nr:hypothetical protein [Candidatus Pacearchaeota archaeon]
MVKTKAEKPWYKRWWAIILFIFVGLIILGGLFGDNNSTSNNNPSSNNQESNSQVNDCVPDWQCISWSECSEFGKQTRTCQDNNNCGTNSGKPAVTQTCIYVVVEPEPITISGSGQQASEYFELEQGLSIFKLNSNGNGHFSMVLYDDEGEYIDLLVNEVGSFDGSKLVAIDKSGKYLLDVSADGSWQAHITQPRNIEKSETPLTLSGNGQEASDFFYLKNGMRRFSISHSGSGHFSMVLYSADGDYMDLLVNEVGSFDGSKAVSLSTSGNYLLDVSADGNWEFSIE